MYGFPCCTERVTNPDYDSEGNAYGKKGNDSCIIPKGCKKCIIIKKDEIKDSYITTAFTANVTASVTAWSAATVYPTSVATN